MSRISERRPGCRLRKNSRQLVLEAADVGDDDVVHMALGYGVDRHHLLLDRNRGELGLLEHLDHPASALQLCKRRGVQLRAELGKCRQLAELSQVEAERAGDLPHGRYLGGATDPGDRDAGVEGGADALEEQIGEQIALPVGDRDDVGRDVSRDVVGLGLDHREPGERAATELVGELGATLEEPAVQVEHIAGVRLTAGRPAQKQRDLAIGHSLLREVVEDDQGMLPVVHPVLADGRAGIWGIHLQRRCGGGGGIDHDGVLHGAVLFEGGHDLGDGGGLLPDGHVDALDLVLGPLVDLLVDDRVDHDGGLADLAVADDQLALPTADRGHRIDGLDPGLERFLDRLPLHHRWRLSLEETALGGVDRAFAVHGIAQRVDDTAEQGISHRDRKHRAGLLDRVAFLDVAGLSEDHHSEVLFVDVEGDSDQATGKLEQLGRHDIGQALDAGDAVGDGGDVSDGLLVDLRLPARKLLLEGLGDLVGSDGQIGHMTPQRLSTA